MSSSLYLLSLVLLIWTHFCSTYQALASMVKYTLGFMCLLLAAAAVQALCGPPRMAWWPLADLSLPLYTLKPDGRLKASSGKYLLYLIPRMMSTHLPPISPSMLISLSGWPALVAAPTSSSQASASCTSGNSAVTFGIRRPVNVAFCLVEASSRWNCSSP